MIFQIDSSADESYADRLRQVAFKIATALPEDLAVGVSEVIKELADTADYFKAPNYEELVSRIESFAEQGMQVRKRGS